MTKDVRILLVGERKLHFHFSSFVLFSRNSLVIVMPPPYQTDIQLWTCLFVHPFIPHFRTQYYENEWTSGPHGRSM